MTVTAAICALIVALAPVAGWLIMRWLKRKADPDEQNRERKEEIDRIIAKRDGIGASVLVNDLLDGLPDADKGDSSGQNPDTTDGGKGV